MKKVLVLCVVILGVMHAAELKKVSFESYLLSFDYKERNEN